MAKIKLLDTFAGVGGFHLALEQSIGKENVECIGYSEIDKFAKQTYEGNLPGIKDLGSITDLDIDNLEDFDLLTGGIPCQPFSVAGKQLGPEDSRGEPMWNAYINILEKKQPKYFIIENVKGLMSKKFKPFMDKIFQRIRDAGYEIKYEILTTSNFQLPQKRQRIFIVGKLSPHKGIFNFPQGEKLTTFLKDIIEEEVDEKYYMTAEQYNKLSYDSIKRIYDTIAPTLDTAQGGHRQPKIKVGHNVRTREFKSTGFNNICPTLLSRDYKDPKQIIKIKNATKKGYLEAEVGDGINLSFPDSKTRRGRVTKKISGTLLCNDMNGILDEDYRIRKLTPTEYERLQGYPDGWSTDFVSNSQAYKQMGNAISVPVVKSIFDNLFKNG